MDTNYFNHFLFVISLRIAAKNESYSLKKCASFVLSIDCSFNRLFIPLKDIY